MTDNKDDIVWLYRVIDTNSMTAEALQGVLDSYSNGIMPHELIDCQNGKLVIKFQSALKRQAYFKAQANAMDFGA